KFGGNGIDIGYAVKQTLDRQYIVAGSTSSHGAGNTDFFLLKVDSMGQFMWEKNFGGFNNDVARSVIQLADSGYVITGFTNSFGNGGYDFLTIRTDKMGNTIWQVPFGGQDWDFAYDVVQCSDGGIVVCGSTTSFGSGKMDGCVIKYDMNGNFLWQKFFGGTEDDDLRAIIITNDNNLAVVGRNSYYDVNGDCFFAKLTNTGDTIFTRFYGGINKDYANDLVQKGLDSSYIIGGAQTFSTNTKTQSMMYCLHKNGDAWWNNNFYWDNNDGAWVCLASSYLKPNYTGYVRNDQVTNFKQQGTIFYAQPTGFPEIANSAGGPDDETIYGIDGTRDGGFVRVGTTKSFGSINGDIYFVKQDTLIINYADAVRIGENLKSDDFVFLIKKHSKIFEAENLNSRLFDMVTVYDLTGKIIKQTKCQFEIEVLNLSEFSNSIYLISFSKENKLVYKTKIIND
nr:T9SS type A sorting domain-containing protein [Bacteroidota bacterium]